VWREEGGHYTVSKGISDISDQRSGSGKTIMAKGCGVARGRKERFLTPQTPFGMMELA
jgi:hypothetical protein